MEPATNPNIDYKALVQRGYDLCASAYEKARQGETNLELEILISSLTNGAHVLDIGCGSGIPITRTLAQHFRLTGIDISGEQVRRARINVPAGTFIQADIMSFDFPLAEFDGVVAFYSIFHLPREEHFELFGRIYKWLKPNGYLLATVSSFAETAYTEDDFFDVQMYWSNYGLDDYKSILSEIGFKVLEVAVIGHGYSQGETTPTEHHPLIFAQVA